MITATTKSALKKTSMALAAAAIATLTIQGSAEAKPHVYFHIGAPGIYWGTGPAYGYGHWGHYNPCRHWKRKYHRTGRVRFLRKYRRCMRRYF